MEEVESAVNIPESLMIDTSHTSQHPPVLQSTSQPCTNTDKRHQQCPLPEHAEQEMVIHQDGDEHSAKNIVVEPTSKSDQPLTVFLPTDDITMLTEKVGCILVTSHLQQFLENYHPSSDKHAFLDVYHMLSLLDK